MKCNLCIICILCIGYILSLRCDDHYPPLTEAPITSLSPDTVRHIEDAAATLIATGVPTPNNEQVRAHPGGGSLSHISPVMREVVAERDRLLQEVHALRDEALPLRVQAARLIATREHQATQLNWPSYALSRNGPDLMQLFLATTHGRRFKKD
ncbi:UNVERIFIED_ORG: hypothetical protein QE398_000799 [Atlantibacter sp. SORGH_AS 304]|jgi:hypothetical protein|nr:hypothetical protein [Atlantibacter sp. SORGH_AS_0304]